MKTLSLFLTFVAMTAYAVEARHVVVYKEPGRFAGWPANNGIWNWGDEIVVGFHLGHFKVNPLGGHAVDGRKPTVSRFARSLDGGETWRIEDLPFNADKKAWEDAPECPGDVDFTHPDFAMTLRMVSSKQGYSRFFYTTDRWKTASGPFKLPEFGRKSVSARTDYVVLGPRDILACMTAAKDNGWEGRAFCTRTTDGGKTWNFLSWITPDPGSGYTIMPSTLRAGGDAFITAIRCKGPHDTYWIDLYRSDDAGKSWQLLDRAADKTGGNPPSMIRLKDGRIALTYGYRNEPYGIRARISGDDGRTWGDELVLRQDGGGWDLGYPRTVQRSDGNVVTVYYFNDDENSERYIGATIWKP